MQTLLWLDGFRKPEYYIKSDYIILYGKELLEILFFPWKNSICYK